MRQVERIEHRSGDGVWFGVRYEVHRSEHHPAG
jgi:hypothetical protein